MTMRILLWTIKLAISGFLIWFVVGKVDIGAAWAQAKEFNFYMLALAFIVNFFQIILGAERWLRVIRSIGGNLKRWQAIEYHYTGLFFNLALPGMVGGDALRIWKSHKAGLRFSMAFNAVMLERVATVFALLLLVTVLGPLLIARLGDNPATYAFPILTGISLIGLAVLMSMDYLAVRFIQWRLIQALAHLAADARSLFLSLFHGPRVLGLAAMGHAILALEVYILAIGLSVNVTLVDCLVLIPPVVLVMTLPISISGWGLREGAMVTAFSFIGVPAESALVLSVVFGLVTMGVAVPGGAFWLMSRDRNKEVLDLIEEAEEVDKEG